MTDSRTSWIEPGETCWHVVDRARHGDDDARGELASSYMAVVRAFLAKRWHSGPSSQLVDDALQEVFVDLYKEGGALGRFESAKGTSFRAFLFGVTKNVALRHEERAKRERSRRVDQGSRGFDAWPSDDTAVSRVFDREWAVALMQRARTRLETLAAEKGDAALLRVEILRQRFEEGRPIRDIAQQLDLDASKAHHEYAKAREEFKTSLRAEIAFHVSGTKEQLDHECRLLLDLLAGHQPGT
ncbi:MAG: sigma-70 family RNA polymerase sigma factor [Planctomycetes bacterium]|nr:sigma-70 family RNA polymerase sigma factor [Planctomycetota bacterium]